MAFRDLDGFLVVEPIVLPIGGVKYAFPGEISARSWLRLQRMTERMQAAAASDAPAALEEVLLDDAEEEALTREILGGVDEEMVANGCTSTQIKAVFYTLVAYHISGQEAAEAVWEAQGERGGPNRQARRSPAPTRPARSRASRAGSSARKAKPKPSPEPES